MKKVLVFDRPETISGHRLPYASYVSNSFSGCDVTVCLPEQLKGESVLQRYFKGKGVHFYNTRFFSSGFKDAKEAFRNLAEVIEEKKPDHVAIPTADGIANVGGLRNLFSVGRLFGNVRIDICLMVGVRPSSHLTLLSKLKNQLKWKLITLGPWRRIMLMDPVAWDEFGNQRVVLCPDPVEPLPAISKEEARRMLSLPQKGKLIVSVGNQDERKGVDLLIRAFAKTDLDTDNHLLLFGVMSEGVKHVYSRLIEEGGEDSKRIKEKCIIIDRYATEDEFQAAVVASDVVAAPYRSTDRPSGVVSRAICWGKTVICTNSGWLKWVCEKTDSGKTSDPFDTSKFAGDLNSLLTDEQNIGNVQSSVAFAEFHTRENYQNLWLQGVD